MPEIKMNMVMMEAGFTNLLNSKQTAAATCDNFMAQAIGMPIGANPISFK